MGRAACDRLLALSRGDISSCHESLPVKLVVRESTGPVRKK
jgi:DNA-binding LacI/PurR family transcriptional regulator